MAQLHDDLSNTGANPPVLRQIRAYANEIGTAKEIKTQKLWERVRAQNQAADREIGLNRDMNAEREKVRSKLKSKPRPKLR